MSDFYDDPKGPARLAVALLTAGVGEDGLPILEQATDELDREGLVEVIAALVGLTRQIVTDEQLQRAGRFLA